MLNHKRLSKLGINSLHDLEAILARDDVKIMIGKNYDHYRSLWINRYRRLVMKEDIEKEKGGFCWLAFLACIAWFGYRRMYMLLFVFIIMIAALVFAETYYDLRSTSLLGLAVFMGFWGKDFYLDHIIASTQKIDKLPNQERVDRFLKWRTGVSQFWAWVAVPLSIALNFIVIIVAEMLKAPVGG